MKKISYLLILLLFSSKIFAQNTTILPDRVSVPKMTTATKNALPNKTEGMMVYDANLQQYSYWTGTAWVNINSSAANSQWSVGTSGIYNTDLGQVSIGTQNPSQVSRLTVWDNYDPSTSYLSAYTGNSPTNGFLVGGKFSQGAPPNYIIQLDSYLWDYERGNMLLGTNNKERLKITNDGEIRLNGSNDYVANGITNNIAGKLTTYGTGYGNNLLPACYGTVSSAGVKLHGTNNFTVTKSVTDAGHYTIQVTTESNFSTINSTCIATVIGGASSPKIANVSTQSFSSFTVIIYNLAGNWEDNPFSFVVYRQ